MVNWNLGSVGDQIHKMVDDIPSSLSGAALLNIIDQRRLYMENFLGATIGSTAITEKYQGPLTSLSIAKTLFVINTQGTDADSVSLGEFSIKKGGSSSALSTAKEWERNAMEDLINLKGKARFFKALG